MKMPGINKQSIGTFFLHHTEKLILALCLALFGLFLWMGLKSKPFDASSPSDLVRSAERADKHVKKPTVWDAIKPYRKGRTEVLATITGFEKDGLKASAYSIDTLSGVPALTLSARLDPELQVPQQPIARHIRAPLLITSGADDVYSELTLIAAPEINIGSGNRNTGNSGYSGGNDYDEEDYDEGDFAYGDEYEAQSTGRDSGKEEEEAEPTVDAGSQVQTVYSHTTPGLNPKALSIGSDKIKARLVDIICVTAVLDIQKQFQSFDSLAKSIGYYPDRDKPVYQHVEVHRRVKGGRWEDRSEFIQFGLPARYPVMHKMPRTSHSSAPDNTAPPNFDPVLTGPNPPVAFVDYLPLIGHPALSATRQFPDIVEETAEDGSDFGFESESPAGAPGLGGSDSRSGGGRGRVPRRSAAGGQRPGGSTARGGSTTRGGAGSRFDEEFVQSRSGADFTDYMKSLLATRPEEKFKLVRFFDVETNLRSTKTFEYRMRVWVGDPNNEDPREEFISFQQSGGGSGSRSGGGGYDDEEDEYDEDESSYGGGRSSRSQRPQGRSTGARKDLGPKKIEITSNMKDITVRRRLDRATASEPTDPNAFPVYTVAEMRKKKVKGADGKETIAEEFETIRVPANHSYLRYARPSDWSELVSITVSPDNSQVAVGKVVAPKQLKLKVNGVDAFFPIGEPQLEIAASTWSGKYGTAVPTKQTVSRGELLSFHAPSHIVHPITWKVYLTKNPNAAQGEDRFKVPIRTGKFVVDSMGGTELPLPRAEKMRHSLASEILVMDASGNFTLSNDMTDRTTFRNLLLQPDESQVVGRPKRPKKKKTPRGSYGDEYDGDFGE